LKLVVVQRLNDGFVVIPYLGIGFHPVGTEQSHGVSSSLICGYHAEPWGVSGMAGVMYYGKIISWRTNL
jgi:hypothetical protein